jgi:hypothetical protein
MNFRFTLENDTEGSEVLELSPKGWDDVEISIERDPKLHGLFFEYSIKLDFFCNGGGKEFIDTVFDEQGVEGLIDITIEIDCNDSGTFEEFYTGRLNLNTYERVYSAPEFTSCNIEQEGIQKTLLNRFDTKINLSELTTLDGTVLSAFTELAPTLHSKLIQYTSILDIYTTPHGEYQGEFGTFQHMHIDLPFNRIALDDLNGLAVPSSDNFYHDIVAEDYPQIIFANDAVSKAVSIEFNTIGSVLIPSYTPVPAPFDAYLVIAKGLEPSVGTVIYSQALGTIDPTITIGGIVYVNFTAATTFSTTIAANEILIAYVELRDVNITLDPDDDNIEITASVLDLTIIHESTTPTTSTCRMFGIHEAFARVLQSITDQADPLRSEYFGRTNSQPNTYDENGCGSFTGITNGFQIRQFPIADRPIYASLKELFEGCNAIYNLGMGIEEDSGTFRVRIEPKSYFYSTEELFTISNVRDFHIFSKEELYYNEIQVGFAKWENEEINGLDEFNTNRSYSIALKNITPNKLTQLSTLMAGGYAIEFTRRKTYLDANTEDWKYDDNLFIICLNRTLSGGNPTLPSAEIDENFTSVTGVISPATAYNLRLSPARIIRNWFNFIGQGIIKSNALLKTLKFIYGQGNYQLVSQGSDACDFGDNTSINEGANIDFTIPNANTDLNPLFRPETIEFEAPLSWTQYKLIRANPGQCIQVSPTSSDYVNGFIQEVRYYPVKGKAKFVLLRTNEDAEECSHVYVVEDYVECDYVE